MAVIVETMIGRCGAGSGGAVATARVAWVGVGGLVGVCSSESGESVETEVEEG